MKARAKIYNGETGVERFETRDLDEQEVQMILNWDYSMFELFNEFEIVEDVLFLEGPYQ